MGYGLQKLMTESPDKEYKGLDWITLSRSYLKVDVQVQCILVLSRGQCVGLIIKWHDRLKASLLLNGGQFEH